MSEHTDLLLALIDALGYKVEKSVDYKEMELTEEEGQRTYIRNNMMFVRERVLKVKNGEYVRGENGSYFSTLSNPVIKYKVIPK